MTTRIAVLQISLGALREKYEVTDASEGWSAFEGADGTRLEVCSRGSALLVRFEGPSGTLSGCFGELWQHHAESRGIAVHDEAPDGDDYDSLVEGASWEGGGLFAMAASALGGSSKRADPDVSEREGESDGEGEQGEGEDDPFDAVANKLMSAVNKRSSRKVLAVRLAADKGEKDLGDVLDAMESEDAEGDDALVAEVEGRFAFDAEHQEMAELLGRKLTTEDGEEPGENDGEQPAEQAEAAATETETDE
jgi:hypothetical protein